MKAFPPISDLQSQEKNKLIKIEFDDYQMSSFDHVDEDSDLQAFWIGMYTKSLKKEKKLQHLSRYFLRLLLLPHSTAEVERVFSIATNTKTKNRSRITTLTLEALIITKQFEEGCIFYRFRDLMSKSKATECITTSSAIDLHQIQVEDSEALDGIDETIFDMDGSDFSDFD